MKGEGGEAARGGAAARETGIHAQVTGCADPRQGVWVEVVQAWRGTLGLRSGLASSSPSVPPSPLPSAPRRLCAESRKLQAFVSDPGAWEEVEGVAVSAAAEDCGSVSPGRGNCGRREEWGPRAGLRVQDLFGVLTPSQWPQGRREVK